MIPNEAEFLGALRKVIAAFDSLAIEYALGGSLASSLHGEARATRDADLIAAVAGQHATPLVAALGTEFYADTAQITAAAMNQGSFNLIHLATMAKVDVYVVWRTDFGRTQLARRRASQIGQATPLKLFITSPEDTILAKLDWYRNGGCVSDRQWRDVLGVLKVQASASLKSGDIDAYKSKVILKLRFGKTSEAADVCKAWIHDAPASWLSHLTYAHVRCRLGEVDHAATEFTEWVQAHPNFAHGIYLALFELREGRTNQALIGVRLALQQPFIEPPGTEGNKTDITTQGRGAAVAR